ncbi:hypothetical protein PMKS-001508 [Pichia membranifaciens]|uniref:Uncharacterized protein n=1 Tax=Pichia membranifaciens TaxID=4926 RepID=A0A1Q2YEQ4_9ASCO|nr:hypothetical protein PMKS-001508 [Pichia membranifaciens]
MFPECDPNKYEDIENIAKVLYVKLPKEDEESSSGSTAETASAPSTVSPSTAKENGSMVQKIASQIDAFKSITNGANGNKYKFLEDAVAASASAEGKPASDVVIKKEVKDEEAKDEAMEKNKPMTQLNQHLIGLGGAERLSKKSSDSNEEIIKFLSMGIKSSMDLVELIKVSSYGVDFNGLLYYDLFYAYNALMLLLLGFTLIKHGVKDKESEQYNFLADILCQEYSVDIPAILKTINDIKDINMRYGSTATSVMKDASNNITLLLRYFKITSDTTSENNPSQPVNPFNLSSGQLPMSDNIPIIPQDQSTMYMGDANNIHLSPSSPFDSFLNADNEFFEIIQSINTEIQPKPLGLNDKIFWDWSKMFSMDE